MEASLVVGAFPLIKIMTILFRCICFFVCLCGILGNVEREGFVALGSRGQKGAIVNYAEIRARVANGFIEKANEMADALAVLQDLSRASSGLREQISKHCPK